MLGKLRREEKSIYDEPIQKVLTEMETYDPNSQEYSAAISHLEVLTKLKNETRSKRVSADTVAVVAGNLLGILIIVGYEQNHVMTSKAMGFINKPK